MKTGSLLLAMVLMLGSVQLGFSQSTNTLQAGAAKVDFTPSENALPEGYDRINDHLFVRAVVIDNGSTSAALIAVDQGMISNELYNEVTRRAESELGIPAVNISIAASHSHSSPRGEGGIDATQAAFDAVRMAQENMVPATISYNTGLSYLNVNRDAIDPVTRLWAQEPNHDGPSDKTVAVITIRDMEGQPIAVNYNYGMHANMLYSSGIISADFPGMASQYIEEYHGNGVIALYSSGAAGDQNPVSIGPMRGGGTEAAKARQVQMIESLGQILAEEVLRVMELPQMNEAEYIDIYGSQRVVACPGRARLDNAREGVPGVYEDGEEVNITLSLLRLGDIAITGVNAEVYTVIAEKLKEESPLNHTIFSSITNGRANSGYIPSDDAFQRYTFQVLSSRLKPNCAERAIIDGFVEMIDESSAQVMH